MEDTSTAPEAIYDFTTHAAKGGRRGVHLSIHLKTGEQVNVFLDEREAGRLLRGLSDSFVHMAEIAIAESRVCE